MVPSAHRHDHLPCAVVNHDAMFAQRLKYAGMSSSVNGDIRMEYPSILFCIASISDAMVAEKGQYGQQNFKRGKLCTSINEATVHVNKDLILSVSSFA